MLTDWPRIARGVAAAGLLVVFVLGDAYAMHALFTSRVPGANDFYARWLPMRAWLFEGRSPYADSVTLDTQVGMYGRPALPAEDKGFFSYPFFSFVFFAPLALIASYAWASALWLSLLQVSLFALVALSLAWSGWRPPAWSRGLALLFGLFWYHSARTLILGQFAAIEALLILGALLAARAGYDAWAGVLLALATVKFQMAFLVIPGLLLWQASLKRWRMAFWFAGTLAGLVGVAFVLLPTWWVEWSRQLTTYVDNSFIPGPVAILVRSLLPGADTWPEYAVYGALLIHLLWNWWQARSSAGRLFEWTAALTLVITNLVVVRTATTNYVMMMPALFLLFAFAHERWGGRGLALVAAAQAALFFGLWALFFMTVRGDQEHAAMYLPLPILLFAGLVIVRKAWVVQIPAPA
jgi:hypothetical protein